MVKKKFLIIGIILIVVIIALIAIIGLCLNKNITKKDDVIKLGYIGSITGPLSKYGSYEAVTLAVDNINKAGGINGKQIKLIAEDGKGDSKEAVNAVNKLITMDGVKVILGGHCAAESLAIAPIVEQNKVIMLASITTTPKLTPMGDYVFRTSPVSLIQSDIVADSLYNKLHKRKLAIVYEQTDYAMPIAEKLKANFTQYGGEVVLFEQYAPGVIDFRTLLAKVKDDNADALFLSAQSPASVLNFMKQVKELGLNIQLSGNDASVNQSTIDEIPNLYENYILAAPNFDLNNSKTSDFIKQYTAKYNTKDLPYGIWTAESYDAVYIIKKCVEEYGETPDQIKQCLYNIKDFQGTAGSISIDANGDGIRAYYPKIVKSGIVLDFP